MVCEDCQKKLNKLVTVDDQKRRQYGNLKIKDLTYKIKSKFKMRFCKNCKGRCEGENNYCLTCAHKNGICEICGKKLINTIMFKFCDIESKDYLRKKRSMANSKILSEKIIKEKGLDQIIEKNRKNKNKYNKKIKDNNEEKDEIKPKKEFIPLTLNEDEKNNNSENLYDEIINL
jgi:hypothetical protein